MKRTRPEPVIAAPALLLKWQTWVVGLAVMLIPFFVPIPMSLRRHPIISPLGDQLHIFLLAGVTLLLYWRGPLAGRLRATAIVAAIIGGAIEFIQIPFGRQAHILDFVLDLVGIGVVVGFMLWRGYGRKIGLWLILGLLVVIPIRLHRMPFVAVVAYRGQEVFPIIADLEGVCDSWVWSGNSATVEVVEIPDSPQGQGHVIRLEGGPPDHWPSAEMHRFPHDWTDYETLLVDVRLVAGSRDGQPFCVRIDDFAGHRDETWIYSPFVATTEWQTFRVPLQDRKVTNGAQLLPRIFDLHDVDHIILYLPLPKESVTVEIDNLRLE